MLLLPFLIVLPIVLILAGVGEGYYARSLKAELDDDQDATALSNAGRMVFFTVAGLVVLAVLLIVMRFVILM